MNKSALSGEQHLRNSRYKAFEVAMHTDCHLCFLLRTRNPLPFVCFLPSFSDFPSVQNLNSLISIAKCQYAAHVDVETFPFIIQLKGILECVQLDSSCVF
jgi:hypothetical protein